jgi:ATP-dependent Clp protease protease subunit
MKTTLNRLIADNRGRGIFRVENAAADVATIYLYDVIVDDDLFGGVSALSFVTQLASITAKTVHLRINSPGGDVFAGQAMAQCIREHPAKVVSHIDGVAASAASWVAIAADEVIIAPGAMMMIHRANTITCGNANDLMETAALLEKVDSILVSAYVEATGQEAQQIMDWMDEETWFSAVEAVQYGFADSIAESAPKTVNASGQWNLSAWGNAPQLATDDPAPKGTIPEPAPDPAPEIDPTDHLRRRLSLAEHC